MRKTTPLILTLALIGFTAKSGANGVVELDNYTLTQIDHIIETQVAPEKNKNKGDIIKNVSANFLGAPYVAHMLIGSSALPEKLVVDFRGLDCFTYLDYVEALRKSYAPSDFVNNIVRTRYWNNEISYAHRRHFFTDWSHEQPLNAKDVTAEVDLNAVTVTKILNRKSDGGEFEPSLGTIKRNITYIPSKLIDNTVIGRLKTGDYIGIYTPADGLDVTHAGIFIATEQGPMFRNASSRTMNKKVVDSPFMDYIKKTPGIIILRAI
jgi:hypothetical protein